MSGVLGVPRRQSSAITLFVAEHSLLQYDSTATTQHDRYYIRKAYMHTEHEDDTVRAREMSESDIGQGRNTTEASRTLSEAPAL